MENKEPKKPKEVQEGITLMNAQERLRLTILKIAQEEFEKAGSRTAKEEKIK